MNRYKLFNPSFPAILFCAVTCLVGCQKKESQTGFEKNPGSAAPAADQASQDAAARNPEPAGLPAQDQASLAAAQAAMKSKDYKTATSLMIQLTAPPKQPRTQAEAAIIANQMRAFQQNLAGAVASGDPQAIAAAQQLREANRHR